MMNYFLYILFITSFMPLGSCMSNCDISETLKHSLSDFFNGKPEEFISILSNESKNALPAFFMNVQYARFIETSMEFHSIETTENDTTRGYESILVNGRKFDFKTTKDCKVILDKYQLIDLLWQQGQLRLAVCKSLLNENLYEDAIDWIIIEEDKNDIKGYHYFLYSDLRNEFGAIDKLHLVNDRLKESAIDGNITSMLQLGSMYEPFEYILGGEPPEDFAKESSHKWYLMAAKRGNTFALGKVAAAYERGEGVRKNSRKSFAYYKQIETIDSVQTLLKLSQFYKEGKGCKKDILKSKAYLDKAFEIGKEDKYMAIEIGGSYQMGMNGFDIDKEQAIVWYTKAMELGHEAASIHLEILKN